MSKNHNIITTFGSKTNLDIDFNGKYIPFKNYFEDLGNWKIITIEKLRNTYLHDPKVNHAINSYSKIHHLDLLLDSFIKDYLLDILIPKLICEEDKCLGRNEITLYPGKVEGFSCLRWVCKEDLKYHSTKFTCNQCAIQQCICHKHMGNVCRGCPEIKTNNPFLTAKLNKNKN